jgi:hypothetical protein
MAGRLGAPEARASDPIHPRPLTPPPPSRPSKACWPPYPPPGGLPARGRCRKSLSRCRDPPALDSGNTRATVAWQKQLQALGAGPGQAVHARGRERRRGAPGSRPGCPAAGAPARAASRRHGPPAAPSGLPAGQRPTTASSSVLTAWSPRSTAPRSAMTRPRAAATCGGGGGGGGGGPGAGERARVGRGGRRAAGARGRRNGRPRTKTSPRH